ncbi:MAG: hypothetical protein QM820_47805 [Minicystis sp.]
MSGSKPSPKSRVAGRVIRVVAGLAVGLGLSEVAFSVRDHGAFPHLNLYAPDPALGVRLIPGESMKLAFGGNPVTGVRINGAGFRGPELPAPGGDEVVVVGDSQVFGLGVEENETFSARLEGLLPGTRVINAGVPTYGPPEYDRVLAEILEKRKPKRVVYVVNFANDLFEAERPNTERHAVWDGWAVRRETAPAHVAGFPGRDLLFRKSHAVFALRRWWYRRNAPAEAFSLPSEGTFKDIGFAAARAAEEHLHARDDTRRLVKLQSAKVSVANTELRGAADRFITLVGLERIGMETDTPGSIFGGRWDPVKASFAQPGDIVGSDDYGEYTGPLFATANLIVKGAEFRRKIEQRLRDRAKKSAADAARIDPVLDAVDEAQKRADAVRAETVPRIRAWSPLAPGLRRVKALCDAAGARLFVVALPLDVQVSKDEWEKHGTKQVDLEPARILVDDLVDSAEDAGATSIESDGDAARGGAGGVPQARHPPLAEGARGRGQGARRGDLRASIAEARRAQRGPADRAHAADDARGGAAAQGGERARIDGGRLRDVRRRRVADAAVPRGRERQGGAHRRARGGGAARRVGDLPGRVEVGAARAGGAGAAGPGREHHRRLPLAGARAAHRGVLGIAGQRGDDRVPRSRRCGDCQDPRPAEAP